MPAVSLNQLECALQRWVLLRVSFLDGFSFGIRLVLQFNLLALGNVCCPTRAVVLGFSFYPLEQAPNMVIYAMSKSGTATSGLIYVCGFLRPKPRTNARRCCQNIPLRTSGLKG